MRLLRSLTLCCSLCVALPCAAWAQDAGGDAGQMPSMPDASAGEGGADRDNPEGSDSVTRINTTCQFSSDCSRGFGCKDGRCVWLGGYRQASGGNLCDFSQSALALLLGGLALASFARRRR